MFELVGIGEDEFLTYKGRPLVRSGHEIFYGDLNSAAHVEMEIKGEKEVSGFKLPADIMVHLFEKDAPVPKRTFKATGLFDALSTSAHWLDGYK